ncbi:MAG: ABC transporter ATP-binding protein [Vicinamibacterales bacterium]
MGELLLKTWHLLPPATRPRVLRYLPLSFVCSLVEFGGLAAIVPFVAVLGGSNLTLSESPLRRWAEVFGLQDPRIIAVGLGSAIGAAFLMREALSGWLTRYQIRLIADIRCALSEKMMSNYLAQPYSWFLARPTIHLNRNVERLNQVVMGVIQPLTHAAGQAVTSVVLAAGLFALNGPMATLTLGLALTVYTTLYLVLLPRWRRLGQEDLEAQYAETRVAAEVFEGIREARILDCESFFYENFSRQARRRAAAQAWATLAVRFPGYAGRVLFTLGITTAGLVLAFRGGPQESFATLGVFALVLTRIMAGLESLFGTAAAISRQKASIDLFSEGLVSEPVLVPAGPVERFSLHESIELRDMSFRYHPRRAPAVLRVNLVIPRGGRAVVVGATGAGKTTLLDLITGLLTPDEGQILIDGSPLSGREVAWRAGLGYAPQETFLLDDTVARNIAFGVRDVDPKAVERAGRLACLDDFVVDLPDGYDTRVGERGKGLSRGQRQRIGIARALYRDPQVLVLDEATSALDSRTERQLLTNLRALDLTLLMVTHRLSTIRRGDLVFLLEKGTSTTVRDFDHLEELFPVFDERVAAR